MALYVWGDKQLLSVAIHRSLISLFGELNPGRSATETSGEVDLRLLTRSSCAVLGPKKSVP